MRLKTNILYIYTKLEAGMKLTQPHVKASAATYRSKYLKVGEYLRSKSTTPIYITYLTAQINAM